MFWVVVALLYFVLAAVAPSILGLFVNRARSDFGTLSFSLRVVFVVIALTWVAFDRVYPEAKYGSNWSMGVPARLD